MRRKAGLVLNGLGQGILWVLAFYAALVLVVAIAAGLPVFIAGFALHLASRALLEPRPAPRAPERVQGKTARAILDYERDLRGLD